MWHLSTVPEMISSLFSLFMEQSKSQGDKSDQIQGHVSIFKKQTNKQTENKERPTCNDLCSEGKGPGSPS